MTERIIPITLEADNNEEGEHERDNEQQIDELSTNLSEKRPMKINVKSAPKNTEDYLNEFVNFEKPINSTLPNMNVPEKIILVIDRAQDENSTPFEAKNTLFTPLSMLKRAIHIFIKLKMMINKKHQFAIILLNENSVSLVLNFTNDVKKLNSALEKIAECAVEDTFNFNTLFEKILDNVNVPEPIVAEISPHYMVRTIIFWGRSYTFPELSKDTAIDSLLENPYFICDILMTHESADKSNHCNKIFTILQNIDKKGLSYFFPVSRDTIRLHNAMGRLLGHPLQRPHQKLG